MNKKIQSFLKCIAILICMILVIMSIKSGIMKLDYDHKVCCHQENCTICTLIKYAVFFTQNLNDFIKYVSILDIIFFMMYFFIYHKVKLKKNTLIDLKVRLDE